MGAVTHYSREIRELAEQKHTLNGWSYVKIAQFLFDEHGVKAKKKKRNADAPDRPVHRSTILRWIAEVEEDRAKQKEKRATVAGSVVAHDLDWLRELLYEAAAKNNLTDMEILNMFVPHFRGMVGDWRAVYGVDAPKRKAITVSSEEAGMSRDELSKRGERMIADFMRWSEGRDRL